MRLSLAVLFSALIPFAAGAQESPITLRTEVRLTTVDVVVLDKKGVPVSGLTKEDFAVLENKQPQTIRNFEEHVGGPTVYDAPRPGVFTNATAARGGVSNVLLIDWLNTPPADQQFMRDQLVKFVMTQPAGTRTAIFSMGTKVTLLQDFTADPRVLQEALRTLGTKFSPLISKYTSPANQNMVAMETLYESASDPSIQAIIAGLMQVANDRNTRQSSVVTRNNALYTMQCLHDVAQYLTGVNGRKNLLWVSGSFPAFIQRDVQTTGNPFVGNESMDREMRATQNLLASGQIALYPIDPRGVPVPPSQLPDSDDITTSLAAQRRMTGSNSASPKNTDYYQSQFAEHAAMEELADATGGKAFFNTNDIAGAMHQAVDDGSRFYTLSYTPPSGVKPDQFRDIAVTVKGKGLHLAYRRGYYALKSTDGKPVALNTAKTSRAMQPMAPQSSEVLFQLEVSKPAVNVESAKVIGAPVFEALPHGMYQLNALVDFSTLQFSPDTDGKMHGVVDVATVIYDKNGKVLDSRSDRATLALDDARYQAMRKTGMRYHQVIALPDKGDGYVRVAVHDATTDKLGTVQISMANLRESGVKSKP
ncbi:VWA domain-containing protein [Terriglobus sp. RCC_193]|uniref:VWA domain-containing protein n=1 Tax=Terriglobus sp. RCC_193 TaxID=3239218 RepID=UPI003524B6DD